MPKSFFYSFKSPLVYCSSYYYSTLITTNFAQESSRNYQVYSVVGSINILAGIITTIQQFLKISELNEAHRVAL